MVWGLFPIDALRGAHKYYISSKGTYKVGRKDCDVVVQTDVSISRLHAEIIVDEMASDPYLSHARVKDLSKFGTFINKELGGKSLQKKEGSIKDGDLVTFGTGDATFRFCFVPFVILIQSSKRTRRSSSVQEIASCIGADTIDNWSPECTHVIVDEPFPVTLDLIEAIVTKKPIMLSEWLKVLAEKTIQTELPICTAFLPTLSLEGVLVKIVEPKVREKCLAGYTFVLGPLHKYKFGDKFQSLLEVVSAKVVHADEYCSTSQISADGEEHHFVLVVPGECQNEFNHINELSSLPRVTDINAVAAVLSGCLDSSIIEPPSIVVASSYSTDGTIVEDSDVEVNTTISNFVPKTGKSQDAVKSVFEVKGVNEFEHAKETKLHEESKIDIDYSHDSVEKIITPGPREEEVVAVRRLDKGDETDADRYENSDIIFSQDLIVRDTSRQIPFDSNQKNVINFKCFKKRETQSGNSFRNLIPFSKDPYRESDGGSNESADYMREEKKRKQLEAIAEDLFNNEKGRKRASSGASVQALLSRR